MESIEVTCGACEASFRAPAEKSGRRVRCPECSEAIEIPASDGVAQVVLDDAMPSSGGDSEDGVGALPPTGIESALPIVAMSAALAAGIAGAVIWAAITKYTNYEIGYVAWAVGGMVGGAAAFMGAAGRTAGIACAAIALISIVGGKYLAISWIMSDFTAELSDDEVSVEMYDEFMEDARLWQDVDPQDAEAVRTFMVDRFYDDDGRVTAREREDFLEFNATYLDELHSSRPDYETWRGNESTVAPADTFEALKASLGPIDLLFAFFGISTAFGLVAKRGDD